MTPNTSPITNPESHLLTRRDLCTRWRVSIETLKRRERAGVLPCLKLGRTVRYLVQDVLAVENSAKTFTAVSL